MFVIDSLAIQVDNVHDGAQHEGLNLNSWEPLQAKCECDKERSSDEEH